MVNWNIFKRNTPKLEVIEHTKVHDPGARRPGQTFDMGMVEYASRRNDVCYFWSTGIAQKAMSDGYKILDKAGVEPIWWDEFYALNWLENIVRGVILERKFGAVTFALFDTNEIIPFAPTQVKFDLDDKGNFESFILKEYIAEGKEPLPHPFEGDKLDNIFHEVLRPVKYKYQGTSVLEPIWDLANTRAGILKAAGLITERVASGIRKATVYQRSDSGDDSTAVTNMEFGLSRLESDDSSIVLRAGMTPEGQIWKDELEVDTGTGNFNFVDKLSIVHSGLSIATSVPKNFWDGMFFGSLYASDSILRMLHQVLKEIQNSWSIRFEKMIKQWAINNDKTWNIDYHIVWNLEPLKTDQEEAQVNLIRAQTDKILIEMDLATAEELRVKRGFKKLPTNDEQIDESIESDEEIIEKTIV